MILLSVFVLGGAGSPTQRLLRDGYAVMDGVLNAEAAQALRSSASDLFEAGAMRNLEQAGRDDHVLVLDPTSLDSPALAPLRAATQILLSVRNLLVSGHERDEDSSAESLSYFAAAAVPSRMMLARYPPNGGQYVAHLDNDPADPNNAKGPPGLRAMDRVFTCILYLNDGWEEPHAGHLRLFLPTEAAGQGMSTLSVEVAAAGATGEAPFVDIEPIGGRLVIFDSKRILHAVRPSYAERWAVTVWL